MHNMTTMTNEETGVCVCSDFNYLKCFKILIVHVYTQNPGGKCPLFPQRAGAHEWATSILIV